jgi:soluble lytic murein transglycosylase-like protein
MEIRRTPTRPIPWIRSRSLYVVAVFSILSFWSRAYDLSAIDIDQIKKRKNEETLTPIILKAANRHEVDPSIIKAIIMAESSYNPKAVSKRGAIGLMQLMPTTAKALGVEDIFNPEQNINAGVRYFKQMLQKFNGNTTLALAAYNAGSSKVRKYNGVPPYKGTKRFIKNVFKYHKIYKKELKGRTFRTLPIDPHTNPSVVIRERLLPDEPSFNHLHYKP